jgi:hypothetical protein
MAGPPTLVAMSLVGIWSDSIQLGFMEIIFRGLDVDHTGLQIGS